MGETGRISKRDVTKRAVQVDKKIVDFAASHQTSTFARRKPTGKIVVAKTSPKDESGHYYCAWRQA